MTRPPPDAPFAWSAHLQPSEICLDHFTTNGVPAIPVVFLPPADSSIRLKNPKLLQGCLQQVTSSYREVSEVRQFGKNGIVCRSRNLSCVADLLNCTTFAGLPVSPFIPQHLACVKGVIRGIDSSMDAVEVLEQLSHLGVVEVYRCSVMKDGHRLSTETCIVTFAGTCCPTELKVWPMIFRVDTYTRKPQQCGNCLRYGHGQRNCKSSVRCKVCAAAHSASTCSALEPRCALCENAHPADSESCPARVRELQLIQLMETSRCSRGEAWELLKKQSSPTSFSAALLHRNPDSDLQLCKLIEASVEKSVSRAIDRLINVLLPLLPKAQADKLSSSAEKPNVAPTPSDISFPEDDSGSPYPPAPVSPLSSLSQPSLTVPENMDITPASQKRRVASPPSPGSPIPSSGRKGKKKSKGVKDVLAEAVSSILPLDPERTSPT